MLSTGDCIILVNSFDDHSVHIELYITVIYVTRLLRMHVIAQTLLHVILVYLVTCVYIMTSDF